MPRTSCVKNHPAKERLVITRESYVAACENDFVAAALLNLFEYWHNIKLDQYSQAKKYNDIAERHGDNRQQIESLFQWHTMDDLQKSLMGFGRRKVEKALQIILKMGFVSIHKNPNPRYAFDSTRYFLFHPDRVDTWLDNHYNKSNNTECTNVPTEPTKCTSPDIQMCNPEVQSDQPGRTNQSDILYTKTTTKITHKESACDYFEKFWNKWSEVTDKPIKKQKAQDSFFNANINSENLEKILSALNNQAQAKKIKKQNNEFTPQWPDPDTWLRDKRWEDEVNLKAPKGQSANYHKPAEVKERKVLSAEEKAKVNLMMQQAMRSVGIRKQ